MIFKKFKVKNVFCKQVLFPCKKQCLPHELVVSFEILCKYSPANVIAIFNHVTGPLKRRGVPAQVRTSVGEFSTTLL